MYARLQIFIQLSPTLTKLCHIKRDYLVQNAPKRARSDPNPNPKSLIALLIVVCGKSLYNKHFYNVNKRVGHDITSTVTSFAQ